MSDTNTSNNTFICCICGKKFTGWGNDPWPVNKSETARCCDECNGNKVVPARIANLNKMDWR